MRRETKDLAVGLAATCLLGYLVYKSLTKPPRLKAVPRQEHQVLEFCSVQQKCVTPDSLQVLETYIKDTLSKDKLERSANGG